MTTPTTTTTPSLRERQAPLKARYQDEPASARTTITVRSVTDAALATADPPRVRIAPDAAPDQSWEIGAHPMAGGEEGRVCSGDLLLGSLAACQELTIRMVAAAMGITLDKLELTVEGDMDFRGTMGLDPETPVGFDAIRVHAHLVADAPADRLERLVQRAERYCVVNATLGQPPKVELTIGTDSN
jgi:uncharacterized OsmC-like protein